LVIADDNHTEHYRPHTPEAKTAFEGLRRRYLTEQLREQLELNGYHRPRVIRDLNLTRTQVLYTNAGGGPAAVVLSNLVLISWKSATPDRKRLSGAILAWAAAELDGLIVQENSPG